MEKVKVDLLIMGDMELTDCCACHEKGRITAEPRKRLLSVEGMPPCIMIDGVHYDIGNAIVMENPHAKSLLVPEGMTVLVIGKCKSNCE